MGKRITLNQLGVMIEGLGDKINVLGEGQKNIEGKVAHLYGKIDAVHTSLKSEIKVTATILNAKIEETKAELSPKIDRIERKLEEHIKQPAHA